MWPFGIVEPEVLFQSIVKLNAIFKHMDEHAFIFNGLPQALNKNVVNGPAFPVHADSDRPFAHLQQRCIFIAGELAALIRVDDLWLPILFNSFFYYLCAPGGRHDITDAPVDHKSRMHIDDRTQVHKASLHGNIGDVDRPNLIGVINH